MNQTKRAFTLVELSIVLVILGLLIGGVLTGQSLIRAAELRSIATQYNRYITATQTFRDKYFALSGDMANAVAYWGAADGSTGMTAACQTTASTTAATCNGNGNGKIDLNSSSNEQFRFWQHLANAGLIEGSYDGVTHGANTYSGTTANTPSGKISSSLWFINNWTTQSGQTYNFDGVYDHGFMFGGIIVDGYPAGSILKPEEAYNVDMKLDDGSPATGKIVVLARTGLATCTDASLSSTLTAKYLLNSSTATCALYFRQLF